MKRLFLFLLLLPVLTRAETVICKGTVGSRKVTLWLSDDLGCGPGQYYAMYRYDGVSRWLLLAAAQNGKGNYCMTESRFTGVLLLSRAGATFTGQWISPDRRQQLPVKLQAVPARSDELKSLNDEYSKLQYAENDC